MLLIKEPFCSGETIPTGRGLNGKQLSPDESIPVDYRARQVRGSQVVYFNFDLAREMGLIERGHPDRLNPRLRKAILDAFSLVIINEYDLSKGISIEEIVGA